MAARARAWRLANPEKIKVANQKAIAENKEKRAARNKSWLARNREHRRVYRRASYHANRDRETQRAREYKAERKLQLREKNSAYWKANPDLNRFHRSQRRALEFRATPSWADPKKIREIYAAAVRATAETGIPHDVDHAVPLKSPHVCGLHCEANLQVIPAFANRSKRNRHWPDMP